MNIGTGVHSVQHWFVNCHTFDMKHFLAGSCTTNEVSVQNWVAAWITVRCHCCRCRFRWWVFTLTLLCNLYSLSYNNGEPNDTKHFERVFIPIVFQKMSKFNASKSNFLNETLVMKFIMKTKMPNKQKVTKNRQSVAKFLQSFRSYRYTSKRHNVTISVRSRFSGWWQIENRFGYVMWPIKGDAEEKR